MIKYIEVDGTHRYLQGDWSVPESVLDTLPQCANACVLSRFEWDTALGGFGRSHAWEVAGLNLYYYAVPPLAPTFAIPSDELLVITFSHGAQVALHAFADGLKGRLITLNPPIRGDMDAVIAKARPNIRRWVNLYGDWKDLWAVLGAVGDGHFGIRRQFKQADVNIRVPGRHGAALHDQAHCGRWRDWVLEATR